MTTENLRHLLEDFYAGNTTPDDERMLREYFTTHTEVSKEFLSDAAMFRAMDAVVNTPVPSDLDLRIESATVGHHRQRTVKFPLFGSVAAAVAAVFVMIGISRTPAPYREVSDPEEAKEIALQVSQKLQKNVDKLKLLNNINI